MFILAACGDSGQAARSDPSETSSNSVSSDSVVGQVSRYRFARSPIVVYTGANPNPSENIVYWVFARLNRPLPRHGSGKRANLLLDGVRGDGLPVQSSRKRRCYSAEIGSDNDPNHESRLAHPHDGQRVTVTLRFPGRDVARADVSAREVGARDVGYDQANRRYLRRLGCMQ